MFKIPQGTSRRNSVKVLVIFAVCLLGSVLFFVLKEQFSNDSWTDFDFNPSEEDLRENLPSWAVDKQPDKLLGGLIPDGLDERSCLSRYQSAWYRRKQSYMPSSHLVSRLRSYESLHKRCGPESESYDRASESLKLGKSYNTSTDCKYVVWLSRDGLGNRIITLASAFLYALLTDRVLLVDRGANVADLFCEPFPEVSWLIPPDFPIIDEFGNFNKTYPASYGNMVKKNDLSIFNENLIPAHVYVHLVHNYDDDDKLFFCDQHQTVLQKVPWLILKSNVYFAPSFFLMPAFQEELDKLFPEKETVFHFLGRYLFHPTNSVWRAITKFYNANLAMAEEKVGIQIRIFDEEPDPFKHIMEQILDCAIKESLLPQINETKSQTQSNKTKAVLLTSLNSKYYDALRNMYNERITPTGETIRVYQPSHEEHQHSERGVHNKKAWAEMYLLSLTDKLVTSSKSTFGYVAQSLGGLKPWILYKPEEYAAPNPACQRAGSMEPCFQAPPGFDCKSKAGIDTARVVPYVRHCEDMRWTWGLKLFGKDE